MVAIFISNLSNSISSADTDDVGERAMVISLAIKPNYYDSLSSIFGEVMRQFVRQQHFHTPFFVFFFFPLQTRFFQRQQCRVYTTARQIFIVATYTGVQMSYYRVYNDCFVFVWWFLRMPRELVLRLFFVARVLEMIS